MSFPLPKEELPLPWYLIIGLILVIGIVVFLLKKRQRFQSVLLIGRSNSGKTVIFSQLLFGKTPMTYLSMKENVGFYEGKKGKIRIVDIPGNERITNNLFDQYKNDAKGIIFVIDSETIQTELRDVAEYLYDLMVDPVIRSNCDNILIVCNKQDITLAKGSSVIRMLLEKELSILKNLKAKQPNNITEVGGSPKKMALSGNRGKKDFEFAHLKPVKVCFGESAVTSSEEPNVRDITEWLNKC